MADEEKKSGAFSKALKSTFNFFKKHPKIFLVIIILSLLSGISIGLGVDFFTKQKTTKLGFEDIGELATQTAYCTTVNVSNKSRDLFGVEIPFTQSKYIYSYDTVIKAGFDFEKIIVSTNELQKEVNVTLPEVKILSVELDPDSMEVYHEAESIFTRISLTDQKDAQVKMKQRAQDDAIHNGLYENATENAKILLENFIKDVSDFEDYKINFIEK